MILIDDFKKVYLFDKNQKLHCFGPRYNLKQKYNALIPSYNLKREDYNDKSNILTLYLSSKARLQDYEGVKNPNLLGETCLLYFEDQSHILSFK